MSPTSTNPRQRMRFAGAALAAAVATGALATGVAAAGGIDEAAGGGTGTTAVRQIHWGDRDVILAQLQSEYLLEIARTWYVSPGPAPTLTRGDREGILAQLQSEYLLDIARSWYPAADDPDAIGDADR